MASILISREEYDVLKKKEFVYDLEKAKVEQRTKDGLYIDEDRRLLYGLPSRDEALAKLREKLNRETFDEWDEDIK